MFLKCSWDQIATQLTSIVHPGALKRDPDFFLMIYFVTHSGTLGSGNFGGKGLLPWTRLLTLRFFLFFKIMSLTFSHGIEIVRKIYFSTGSMFMIIFWAFMCQAVLSILCTLSHFIFKTTYEVGKIFSLRREKWGPWKCICLTIVPRTLQNWHVNPALRSSQACSLAHFTCDAFLLK